MVLKLTWKFSLFARNQKILPSYVLFLFGISCLEIQNFRSYQTTQKRIQNFWSPKNTTKDSEFLILKEHNEGFRISDPPKYDRNGFSISDTPKIQNFWSPTMTHRRIQNFWSPTKTQKYSEFLIPQRTRTGEDSEFLIYRGTLAGKGFRISHLPSNRIPNILSQKNIVSSGIGIPDHPNNSSEKKKIFLPGLKAVTKSEVKIITEGCWSKLKTDYKFHHINFIQSLV